ncbi:hypothetical protein MOUN0_C02806 [Monosporozyma unispora]
MMSEHNNSPSTEQDMLDKIEDVPLQEFLGEDEKEGNETNAPTDTVTMLLKQHDKLGIALIEQVKQNKTLIQQNKALLEKVQGLENSGHTIKNISREDLREKFETSVHIYSGGKINDPEVRFKKWKDSVVKFHQTYRKYIPDDKFMLTLISSRLDDIAATWFEENKKYFDSETDAIKAIEEKFGSDNSFWEFALRLYPTESPWENKCIKYIGEDFQKLVDVAPNGLTSDFLTLSFFSRLPLAIRGLIVNQKLSQDTPWTALLEFAVNLEPFYINVREKRHERIEGKVTKPYSYKKSKKPPRCSICDQEGHYANRCPNRED